MSSSQMAIEVEHVTKRYPKSRRWREALRRPGRREWTDALRGISLSVPRGTIHGLLGANGAGKTTLVKILATLVLPTTGRARVLGHDVAEAPERVRESLGVVVAEERSFYWRLSGRENLMFFAALHDMAGLERKRRVGELLEIVGLHEDADKSFREYSSGMRQRLAIARGLLGHPKILLMDEPTRALDPPSAAWIRKFVSEQLVRREGATVILATHDLREAETTCHALTLVDRGVVVAEGTVPELKRALARVQRTVIALLPQSDDLISRVRRGLLGPGLEVLDASEDPGRGDDERPKLAVTGSPVDVAATVRMLVEHGGRVVSVREEEGDLGALFERATAHREEAARLRESGA